MKKKPMKAVKLKPAWVESDLSRHTRDALRELARDRGWSELSAAQDAIDAAYERLCERRHEREVYRLPGKIDALIELAERLDERLTRLEQRSEGK